MLEAIRSIEKSPKESKKVFVFTVSLIALTLIGCLSIVANWLSGIDAVSEGLFTAMAWPIVGLSGTLIGFQASVDKNVRAAMFSGRALDKPAKAPKEEEPK